MVGTTWRSWAAGAALAALSGTAAAELTNTAAPVIVGHYDLNVTSVAEHKRFWVDTLGGKAVKIGNVDAIEFPDVYLLLHVQKPTGPTRGTTFDHIGFAVPDVPAMTTKVVANGYGLTVGRGKELGTLEAGKIADLVILGSDPLKDESALLDVDVVVKGGRVVVGGN